MSFLLKKIFHGRIFFVWILDLCIHVQYFIPIAIAHFSTTLALAIMHTLQTQMDALDNASSNRKVTSKLHIFYSSNHKQVKYLLTGPCACLYFAMSLIESDWLDEK